ncbi:MAG TPA: hypothetical protein VHI52_01165, partial [Verrucomicrobiae bacterium]|nr:hypothetical protein [Verrucomicrobiae bacterium]
AGTGGGNGDSLPVALATNGQYALFESAASNLVPGDTNGAMDVFLRDLAASQTMLISVNTNGVPANGVSRGATMTPDARYVAFVASGNDLVANDTNRIPDVFVRDLQSGTTILASVGAVSTNQSVPVGSSESPVLTPDGRFVAFFSTATNMAAGVPPGGDVYVRDLVNSSTVWVSAGAREAVSNALNSATAVAYNQAISDDGQFVVYEASPAAGSAGVILRYHLSSGTTDLLHTNAQAALGAPENFHSIDVTPDGQWVAFVANTNGYNTSCVQLWDAASSSCRLVSGDRDGLVATNSTCDWPSIAPGGRFVVFQTSNPNLTTNALAGDYHLYRRDLSDGSVILLDSGTNGAGSGISPATVPSISADATLVAFDSSDGSLVPNDRNRASDIFVRDVDTPFAELVSAHDPNLPTSTANGVSSLASTSVSGDGRYVAFASEADNLVPVDTNGCRDIFVKDLVSGKTALVSICTNGASGDATSSEPAISADGHYIAFTSSADNLIPGDTNHSMDVFLRDLQTETTRLVSYNSDGVTAGSKDSYSPVLSSDGRFVLFRSMAPLVAGVFSGENLFLRDMQSSLTFALTKSGDGLAAMTPEGRFVAYGAGSITPQLYVWDSLAAKQIYTSNIPSTFGLAITREGKTVIVAGTAGVFG